MKVAIIGAGLAGCGVAYFLIEEGAKVTLFDQRGVGSGASSACSGLLHPYPGLSAKRSIRATEGIAATKQLLQVAAAHTPKVVSEGSGIYRRGVNQEQIEQFRQHAVDWGDVEEVEEGLFLLHTGITVYPEHYFEGLMVHLFKRGLRLDEKRVDDLALLSDYDAIVLACGWGLRTFAQCAHLPLTFTKGQSLKMAGTPPYSKSYIEKGYIAHLGGKKSYDLGATYEKGDFSDAPDLQTAIALLEQRHSTSIDPGQVLECKAGVRVSHKGNYLPIAEQIGERLYLFTGLGSRGLLYHALFGSILSKKISMS